MLLALLTVVAAAQAQAPPVAPRPTAVQLAALKARVVALQDCWYVKRDEACFWSFVTEVSPLRRFPEVRASVFSGAFTGTPDPSTLTLGIDTISLGRPQPTILNAPAADKFYVLRAEDAYRGDGPPDELAGLIKEGYLPPAGALAVIYDVKGTGYVREGMTLYWVRVNGAWMLFSFSAFD